MKKIFRIFTLATLVLVSPVAVMADELFDGIENETAAITLSVTRSSIHVCGANGKVLNVYDVAGKLVTSVSIDGADKTVAVDLQRGCYIIKIGNFVRKVSVN